MAILRNRYGSQAVSEARALRRKNQDLMNKKTLVNRLAISTTWQAPTDLAAETNN